MGFHLIAELQHLAGERSHSCNICSGFKLIEGFWKQNNVRGLGFGVWGLELGIDCWGLSFVDHCDKSVLALKRLEVKVKSHVTLHISHVTHHT